MTSLIGGSVLLIAGAAVALVIGWIAADPVLIWISIGASVMAAVFLALGYYRSKSEVGRAAPGPASPTPVASSSSPPVSASPSASPFPSPSASPTRAPTPAATGSEVEVVALPGRRRYHRPDCRYANVKGAEAMPLTLVKRRGYDPCSICKPET